MRFDPRKNADEHREASSIVDNIEIIAHARRIIDILEAARKSNNTAIYSGSHAQACEFLRIYAGSRSLFFQTTLKASSMGVDWAANVAISTLNSFIQYIEVGLKDAVSPIRRAQLDVVSDFLEQARALLESKHVHPAAPTVIIGATLEEFLRNWIEAEGLSLGHRKPSIDAFCQVLRDAELISKQDVKDITSWAGMRNHAAHGEWDDVSNRDRIALMLEGVNLFMRRYGV